MADANSTANNGVNVAGVARRARRAHQGSGGRAVQVARGLRMEERHAQPLDASKASTVSAQEQHRKTTFKFDADHPEVFASEDKGATPVEYVLVGLASCLTAGIAAVAQNRNIQLKSVTATIEGDMDIAGHPRHRQRRAQRLRAASR